MATINAIAATTAAILGLLEDAYGGEFGKLTFGPMQISDFAADKLPPDGVTLCLYHVAVNAARNRPPRVAPNGIRYRPSLPIDLQYLLTAWSANAEKQQRVLGWA